MPSLTLAIPALGALHRRLLKNLDQRIKIAKRGQQNRHEKWRMAENNVMAFVPESDIDALRRSRRDNGTPAYTTIMLPYTYANLMAFHTYITSVFFARTPVHQFAGRHGETEQQTQALEAMIAYQVDVGVIMGPYYIWFYDAGKYGLGVVGTYWEKEVNHVAMLQAAGDPADPAGKVVVTTEVEVYEGNRVYNISPWDFFPDPRVPVGQFQRGEFVAVRRRITWGEVLRREALGFYMNTDELKKGVGKADQSVGGRSEPDSALERPEEFSYNDDWDQSRPSVIEAYEIYVDLVPKEWGLGPSGYPQKWVFTVTADMAIIFGCQPLGYLHCRFPFDVFESEVEGYGTYNRGLPEILQPIQETMDWLLNTHFYNVRAALNNLFLVDPTKVVMKDFEVADAGGIIRLKPEAYGQDMRTFFHQVPIADVTQQNIGDLGLMQNLGEKASGINESMMGVLQGSSRRTATEVRSSTGFGVSRLKTVSEYASCTAFTPHSQKLVMNSQQYYQADKKFRIVGDLALQAGAGFVQTNPALIAGFYDFVPVDGTLPIDRMAQATLWKDIMSALFKMPQLMMGFDMTKMFMWVAQLAGLKNINQFKLAPVQMGSPEALQQQAQAGNIVPLRPPGGPQGLPQSDTRSTGVGSPSTEYTG